MLEYVVHQTQQYIEQMPKQTRKQYGQFFTSKETARFMATLFCVPSSSILRILDPGAGSGILSAALIESLQNRHDIDNIELTCYETDTRILYILRQNLEYIRRHSSVPVSYCICTENYITSQRDCFNGAMSLLDDGQTREYNLCIANPPYKKIGRKTPEAMAMSDICYGTPNLYFLFAAMTLYNLKDNGEMVYIIPRSWTSGAYFKRFREYLLDVGKLQYIHVFTSRQDVFTQEDVLQETMIIKVKKTRKKPTYVTISASQSNYDFYVGHSLRVPYDVVVSSQEYYVYLITNKMEAIAFTYISQWKNTLNDLGFRMRTGLTVGFREKAILCDTDIGQVVPLFYSQHIQHGKIQFPLGKKGEYIRNTKKSVLQPNRNYVFVKRFTSKEEPRRLQCAIYIAENFSKYMMISTDNKLNFIDGIKKALSPCQVYGIYALLNTSLYDTYYRILNGSTQVNATEINSMPVPPLQVIEWLGTQLMVSNDWSSKTCDALMEEVLNGKKRRSKKIS